jgi:hypothetical protein
MRVRQVRGRRATGALALVALVGCAHHQVAILSNPPGAEVRVDDQVLGRTPVSFDERDYMGPHHIGDAFDIRLALPGYQTQHATLVQARSPAGTVALVALTVLLCSPVQGPPKRLPEDEYSFDLLPEPKPPPAPVESRVLPPMIEPTSYACPIPATRPRGSCRP